MCSTAEGIFNNPPHRLHKAALYCTARTHSSRFLSSTTTTSISSRTKQLRNTPSHATGKSSEALRPFSLAYRSACRDLCLAASHRYEKVYHSRRVPAYDVHHSEALYWYHRLFSGSTGFVDDSTKYFRGHFTSPSRYEVPYEIYVRHARIDCCR